ncbi:uncharacterized protein LACBIDRAFT_311168 [Laccaria bicolor S238N-H82]|uniref:Predicted protein n=1 Tax=Laccaria bicolor (strain S238N-H82 / ATCC MYA-4686) TaxID=486041 RepID=B0CZD7_LACBS|nr:uncharacterized protein LACBIDRAFT_311168 [Laccaria bicolor S238N-H82]EDR12130.1 predicted protein [Laccaria bicolor S238N-H82]|eukprot:XP_001876394.1 predicted protein [Laccaria bicolor S238N-H82]
MEHALGLQGKTKPISKRCPSWVYFQPRCSIHILMWPNRAPRSKGSSFTC